MNRATLRKDIIVLPCDPLMRLKPQGSYMVGVPFKASMLSPARGYHTDYLCWLAWARVPSKADADALKCLLNRVSRGGDFLVLVRDYAKYASIKILGAWDTTTKRGR